MNKWIAKHGMLVFMLTLILEISLTILVLYFKINILLGSVLVLVLGYVSFFYTMKVTNNVINDAIKQMNENCNPYPAIDIIPRISFPLKPKIYKFILKLNLAIAKVYAGRFTEARNILEANDVNNVVVPKTIYRFLYYNNYAYLYLAENQLEEAMPFFEKQKEIIEELSNESDKAKLKEYSRFNEASILMINEKFKEAEELLQLPLEVNDTMLNKINDEFLLAQIYIKTDRIAQAKEKLEFVIQNGNKLYHVQKAKALLETLN